MHVLQWIAAVSLYLGSSHLPSFLPSLLPPLHRELADTNHVAGKDLHSLSLEVVELLKETCGKDAFSKAYAIVQKKVIAVREKRRKQAVLEVKNFPLNYSSKFDGLFSIFRRLSTLRRVYSGRNAKMS